MFTTWPPQTDSKMTPPSKKYAIIYYIYNKNWRRRARKIIFYFVSNIFLGKQVQWNQN